ncbi:FAD-dependent oxidoreductase [Novosphingobium sp. MMS21-SN21R]|uniref:FAD-dependent oxidoreductase n=1 Tax=Novosphingobium sp. MMS21-SN21R TaxID=2969298 RepID=UPI0028853227|nr:FAD-dependent oxidoreductase [Novosphingobium sp. MMS21-SN21R]MDT0509918.1 FAD-dependent oxidoreductase [Novosphingobium sp. MMS21-SN21R]
MSGFDETFDFVVVGSGGGSMCAAIVACSAGKSAVVLEKCDQIGGTTARSGGVMWIPNNPFMAKAGVPDSIEAATKYLDAVVGDHNDTPGASKARRKALLEEGPRMLDFLIGKGLKFSRISSWPDYYDEAPGSSVPGRTVVADLFDANELGEAKKLLRPNFLTLPVSLEDALKLPHVKKSWPAKKALMRMGLRIIGAKLTGKNYVTAGAALQGRMMQAALKAGAQLRVKSAVKELIVADGRVVGVVTEKDGKPHRVGARLGVLVNAGGFALNQAMRDQYMPGTSTGHTSVAEGDTGEMIQEMMRHGAAIAQMDSFVGSQLALPPGGEAWPIKPGAQGLTAAPHAILVDQSGVRYLNEGGSYTEYCQRMIERNKSVPAVPSYAIFDNRVMKNVMIAGTMPGSAKPAEWTEKGFLHTADTIEGLAQSLGVDPAALRGTVDRFNGFVAKGHDDDFKRGARAYDRWLGDPFHKPNETLGEISEGPFHALTVIPGDVGTLGGVVTDEKARVLREDGTPIAGLYATGVSAASVMGRTSPGSGVNVGPSLVWGYVAAKDAVEAA